MTRKSSEQTPITKEKGLAMLKKIGNKERRRQLNTQETRKRGDRA